MLSGTSYTFRRIILAASTAKLRDELAGWNFREFHTTRTLVNKGIKKDRASRGPGPLGDYWKSLSCSGVTPTSLANSGYARETSSEVYPFFGVALAEWVLMNG
jgi:hypothetical protein